MSAGALATIVVVAFLVLAALYIFLDKKRLDKQEEEFSNYLHEERIRKPLQRKYNLQISFLSRSLTPLYFKQTKKGDVKWEPFSEVSDFFDSYVKEKIGPVASKIIEKKTNKGDLHPLYYDQPFLLVPDLANRRVYMLFDILYCREENEKRCAQGLLEKDKRRALTEEEVRALWSATFDEKRYSNCHICHNQDLSLGYCCAGNHDDHHPCHEHQPCEATCNAKEIYYFAPYDEKELEVALLNAPPDLDVDNDLGGSD